MHRDPLPPCYSFDPASPEPRYRQLYQRVRGAIGAGALRPGERIPAMRWLAQELGLARGTVAAAYALLAAEGCIEMRGAAGGVVRGAGRREPDPAPPAGSRLVLPLDLGGSAALLPFQVGVPALDQFPRKAWARLAARAARATQARHMLKECGFGMPGLRAAIAAYLQLARGMRCAPAQVFVTSGYRDTLTRVARVLLAPGQQAWTEDPGFPPTRQLLGALGIRTVPVAVDAEGLDPALGLAAAPRARAAVLTPAHQSPLTVSLSLPRRLALLDWAAATGAWLIEDDYDGEFRYAGQPMPALASLDRDGRVIHFGSFSKVMFPGLRLGYVVVPPGLVGRFELDAATFGSGQPYLTQAIVCEFMHEGHFMRHIQRMRRLYAERSALLRAALVDAAGSRLALDPPAGGMHLLARTEAGADRALAGRLRAMGMAPQPLSPWYAGDFAADGLLLGFANVADAAQAAALAGRLVQALDA